MYWQNHAFITLTDWIHPKHTLFEWTNNILFLLQSTHPKLKQAWNKWWWWKRIKNVKDMRLPFLSLKSLQSIIQRIPKTFSLHPESWVSTKIYINLKNYGWNHQWTNSQYGFFRPPRSDFRSIGSGFRPQGLVSDLLYLISVWFIVRYTRCISLLLQ